MSQECIDHALWQKNLIAAHYILLAMGIILGFIEQYGAGIFMILVSLGIYSWASRRHTKHVQWHAENDMPYDFKP